RYGARCSGPGTRPVPDQRGGACLRHRRVDVKYGFCQRETAIGLRHEAAWCLGYRGSIGYRRTAAFGTFRPIVAGMGSWGGVPPYLPFAIAVGSAQLGRFRSFDDLGGEGKVTSESVVFC